MYVTLYILYIIYIGNTNLVWAISPVYVTKIHMIQTVGGNLAFEKSCSSESSCVEYISNLIGLLISKISQHIISYEFEKPALNFVEMFEFKIKSPVGKFSKKHLERYQGRALRSASQQLIVKAPLVLVTGSRDCQNFNLGLSSPKKLSTSVKIKFMVSPSKAGTAIGQTIVCMDDSFEVHEWCLFNSDILLTFFEGKLFRFRIQ